MRSVLSGSLPSSLGPCPTSTAGSPAAKNLAYAHIWGGEGIALNVAINMKKSNGLHSLKINFLEITLSFVFVSLIEIYLGKKAPHKLTEMQERIS